ncbi:Hypothetical predicted protein [Octopus vulgaris]|uniref:Uncharacterized protein n=1 Tax=Octopus vulgaris TaxID=6645 RepID=A0AA36F6B3_OCTVU|nr:Hypothetical predicted protein [Octopus vulgaris]
MNISKDMTTSNNQSDSINDEIVVESDSLKASSSNHYNSSGAHCNDIFEIKDSECIVVDAISTAANKEPIYIDLTALSDEEDDSIKEPNGSNMEADSSNMETDGSNMKADDFRFPVVEYRVGCKGKQQSYAVLPTKCYNSLIPNTNYYSYQILYRNIFPVINVCLGITCVLNILFGKLNIIEERQNA